MLERVIDGAGKMGIVAIPASEAAEKVGWVLDPSTFQLISAAGVFALIIDRTVRLVWAYHDRKNKKSRKKAAK